jgi:hypothetical protein
MQLSEIHPLVIIKSKKIKVTGMIGLVGQVRKVKSILIKLVFYYVYFLINLIGNGAPRWNYNKQNLSEMLEPRNPLFQNPRPRNFNSSIDMYTSYNPTSLSGNMSPRRFRSDHHNHYELNPR